MNPVHAGPSLARQLDLCADAVAAVREGQSLTDVLAGVAPDLRPGVQALSFHVLRWLGAAQALRGLLAERAPPPRVDALLLTSLALLWPASQPPYAAHTLVDQAVAAARRRAPASAGFVNAVLRRFLREQPALVERLASSPEASLNHPPWWIRRLQADWPGQAESLLRAAQGRPPMSLRVNRRRMTPGDYLQQLESAGLSARLDPLPGLRGAGQLPPGAAQEPLSITLDQPCAVSRLPGFADGWVSVQDSSAQVAAPLLLGGSPAQPLPPLPPGARVLDACAAPGGKTAHLLELAELELLALDQDAARLLRVRENLQRLGLRAQVQAGDARQPVAWWDGRPFDAILLDAPCTASGIVRRHPDVRWLRRASDVEALAQTQAALLDALWPLLRPGGRLLYATCSLFKAEGSHQIDAFLQRQPGGTALLHPASPGHLLPLPQNAETPLSDAGAPPGDGFCYALLVKR
ncbi:MAG: 16S rRNA (cytosine(967)-C(5))-methyltransferase RsmB [Rubrivivax sp.]|nr:16S rRNA (cytosine(967)-C(5))-methyltransferase RsmB [Rubrivivax sp.]